MFRLQLLLAFVIFSFSLLSAQKTPPQFEGRHKNIYVELLGSNVFMGVNFDIRLKKGKMDGMGLKAGLGGLSISGNSQGTDLSVGIVVLPLEFNYLVGPRRSSFEAGVGILPTYATFSGNGDLTDNRFVSAEGVGLVGGYLTLGYRLQPIKNRGFMMKVNWNPMILRGEGFQPTWLGLSLGMGFK